MLSLIEFLEEIERNDQIVRIPAEDVERLVKRFGSRVRGMGHWNKTTDGSVEIPIANIASVTRDLGSAGLSQALTELRSTNGLSTEASAAAARLVEALADLHMKQFGDKVERFQAATDPAETDALWAEISHELFE
jgi:hypothetical protein